jgi:putative endonuclease
MAHDKPVNNKMGGSLRKNSLGKAGEAVARKYLESKGYQIVQANYRKRFGEVDIIARKDNLFIFCEVKTRKNDAAAAGEYYNDKQQKRLVKISEVYIAENEELLPADYDLRYDLILIGNSGGGPLTVREHIADAFHPV